MKLAALQRDFMAALVGDEPRGWGMESYRRNAFGNWHDALAAAYPVVRRLVGESFFREAARRHAHAFPSASGDLHDYGGRFPEFLAGYAPAAALPYLPDVARLERALAESANAADAPPFDFARLAAVEPDRYAHLVLLLHPSVRLLESPHPVLALWEANQPGLDGTPEGDGRGDHLLVRRHEGEAGAVRLEPSGWRFLARLARGEPLGEAVEALGEGAERAAGLLSQWGAESVVCGFTLAP